MSWGMGAKAQRGRIFRKLPAGNGKPCGPQTGWVVRKFPVKPGLDCLCCWGGRGGARMSSTPFSPESPAVSVDLWDTLYYFSLPPGMVGEAHFFVVKNFFECVCTDRKIRKNRRMTPFPPPNSPPLLSASLSPVSSSCVLRQNFKLRSIYLQMRDR